jgi:hypothetical protein
MTYEGLIQKFQYWVQSQLGYTIGTMKDIVLFYVLSLEANHVLKCETMKGYHVC